MEKCLVLLPTLVIKLQVQKKSRAMRNIAAILFTLALSALSSFGAAEARGGHGGGHFGGGGHLGSFGGGGYRGGFSLGYGAQFYYGGYPYWAYSWPYDYYDPTYGYPTPPDEIGPPAASEGPAPGQYWYYCANPAGYYPYVRTCGNWQAVPALPPPPPP
jgi:hypothetical protein